MSLFKNPLWQTVATSAVLSLPIVLNGGAVASNGGSSSSSSCEDASAVVGADGSCSVKPSAAGIASKEWKLLSWKESGEWVYALLPSSASLSAGDLKANRAGGIDGLKIKLAKLGPGDVVHWERPRIEGLKIDIPPRGERAQIEAFCKSKNLKLQ